MEGEGQKNWTFLLKQRQRGGFYPFPGKNSTLPARWLGWGSVKPKLSFVYAILLHSSVVTTRFPPSLLFYKFTATGGVGVLYVVYLFSFRLALCS